MSNKMKIKLIIFLIIILGSNLWSFQPQKSDFVSNYQYSLYRSWLAKTDADIQKAAGFSETKIIKIFNLNNQQLTVEYPWENHLITEQRQKLEVSFTISTDFDINPFLHYAESMIYRLNCSDSRFALDFLLDEIEIEFQSISGRAAIMQVWREYRDQIIIPQDITIISDNRFGFIVPIDDEKIIFWFDEKVDLAGYYQNIKKQEQVAEVSMEDIKKIESDTVKPDKIRKSVDLTGSNNFPISRVIEDYQYNLSLDRFIREFYNVRQSKELLNNKISDVEQFIRSQYSGINVSGIDDILHIQKGKFGEFGGDIFVQTSQEIDCINILPFTGYEIKNDFLVLPNGEEISLENLKNEELSGLCNAIPHLLYEHRALGSKLLNFLLIHDDVPTTLVVHTDKRELYEVYSYANLLLMLSKYWKDRDTYFSINEIKRVNGKIELIGYLVADDKYRDNYDMAEIWFRLDDQYHFDLIMMMLYPELEK